ncbi:MAG: VWA domain-containing protein [Alphaproteobacteria bacterium]|nr:VWA domain-containing protein [Alphaproteobacteria bacterium]
MYRVANSSAKKTRSGGPVSFAAARKGSVTILFGLMGIVLFLVIGVSIDMARWLHARTETIGAVDAAVLAGARNLQVNGLDSAAAIAIANSYYNANIQGRVPLSMDTIQFKVVDEGTAVTAEGTANLETSFMKLAGINQLPLLKLSGSEFSKAVLQVNGNAESSIEVSLMLDVTGSMCDSGTYNCTSGEKLNAMKEAAKDLINVVVWDNQGSHTSRVALVPFSTAINIGTLSQSIIHSGPNAKKMKNANGSNVWWNRAAICVAERSGSKAYTDAAPVGGDRLAPVYTANGACQPDNPIVPLTANKALLNSTIDGFEARGTTAGHLGTAWTYYTLSPNWGDVMPSASKPDSYAGLTQLNSKGRPMLQKIAVLMTDGEYNTQYCTTGLKDKESSGNNAHKGNCTSANAKSAQQARSICASMKAQGITVYSVGFQLASGGEAEQTLNACASSEDHVYSAQNGNELRQSFRDIALKISALHLSK